MISRFAIHKTIRIIRILFLGGFMQRNFEQVKINEIEINTLVGVMVNQLFSFMAGQKAGIAGETK